MCINVIGFVKGSGENAVQNIGRVDHASRHLVDVGILKGTTGSKEVREAFKKLATDKLEKPKATFDHTLRSGLKVRGFVGRHKNQEIVIFVAKHGQGKIKQGDVVTAIVPSAMQLQNWLPSEKDNNEHNKK